MCASGDIFQAKVYDPLDDIEVIKTYIDDILVLSKDSFEKHIYQPIIIFGRLRAASLKVNQPKWSFGLKEIPYLCYVITRGGIKPDPKNVQVIIDIDWPPTTNEARKLICIIQYYRDMCPRRSNILAPMIEAARGPKVRKYFGMTHYKFPLKK